MAIELTEFASKNAIPRNIVDTLTYNGFYYAEQLVGKTKQELDQMMTGRELSDFELNLLYTKLQQLNTKPNGTGVAHKPTLEEEEEEDNILSDVKAAYDEEEEFPRKKRTEVFDEEEEEKPQPIKVLSKVVDEEEEEGFPCTVKPCTRWFLKKASLAQHLWQTHGVRGKWYGKEKHKKPESHIGSIQTKDIPKKNGYFHCPECDFKHPLRPSLGSHRKTQHGVVGYFSVRLKNQRKQNPKPKELVDLGIPRIPTSEIKMSKATGEYHCPECGKGYGKRSALGTHRSVRHGIKSPKPSYYVPVKKKNKLGRPKKNENMDGGLLEKANMMQKEIHEQESNPNIVLQPGDFKGLHFGERLKQEYRKGLIVGECANRILGHIDEWAEKNGLEADELEARVLAYLQNRVK